ncbi:MAG: alpha/beta fold hydrolase, partial [Anaerolineae bacterium]
MPNPIQSFLKLSFNMHLRSWQPEQADSSKAPFLLIHGLSSNAQTWDAVGQLLADAGHHAVAIDQRNHGLSGKTEDGFDFATITADVNQVLDHLGWERPILVGQSWGGNVLTEFGARYLGRSAGLVMVDGGFLDFGATGESWEAISEKLTPPDIDRFPAETMRYLIQSNHKDWDEVGIDGTMANFKEL